MAQALTMEERRAICGDCERLSAAFAHGVDDRDIEAVLETFTPDGVLERRGESLRGREAIRNALLQRPAALVTRHVCTTIHVRPVDREHATGVVYIVLFRHEGAGGVPAPLDRPEMVGEYEDEYVLTDSGWKIARRVAKAVFRRPAG